MSVNSCRNWKHVATSIWQTGSWHKCEIHIPGFNSAAYPENLKNFAFFSSPPHFLQTSSTIKITRGVSKSKSIEA